MKIFINARFPLWNLLITTHIFCIQAIAFSTPINADTPKEFCAIKPKDECVDLNQTTETILALIQGDSINVMLEQADINAVDLLLKNMSPAEIAFHSEVLNADVPIMLLCYDNTSNIYSEIKRILIEYKKNSVDQYKVVCADVSQIFKVAELVNLSETPTLILFNDGTEIDRLFDIESVDSVEEWLKNSLNELPTIKQTCEKGMKI